MPDQPSMMELGKAAVSPATQRKMEALARETGHRQALRQAVYTCWQEQRLTDALWPADRLARLRPRAPDDVALAALAHLRAGGAGALVRARALAHEALTLHPHHVTAARVAVRLGPTAAAFRPAVAALLWSAPADAECRNEVAQLARQGLLTPAVAHVLDGAVTGHAGPGTGAVALLWHGRLLAEQAAPAEATDSTVWAFHLPVPPDLAGHAALVVVARTRVGGTVLPAPVWGGQIAAQSLAPPRLMARLTRDVQDGSNWRIQAWDAADPRRSVVVLADNGRSPPQRLLFNPAPDVPPGEEGAAPATLDNHPRLRLLFAQTGEPLVDPTLIDEPSPLPDWYRPPPRTTVAGIDIIIPVHGQPALVRECLTRVLASLPATDADFPVGVVLIDDASPEPAMTALLAASTADPRVTVLRNPGNLGFVRTANRGMALHPDRDVVLLNSDAMVESDWLARLRRAAYAAANIGTATALSNDATLLSYPRFDTPVPLVEVPLAAIDRVAAVVNAGQVQEIPTGVGFCFYLRRDCLDEVGYFDAEIFDLGYGEENDFCCRATARGWRHVAALDLYVGHVGGASFGPVKRARLTAALAALARRHPDYLPTVERFAAVDPLAPWRRRIDRQRLLDLAAGQPVALLVCPRLGGGTEQFLTAQAAELAVRGHVVVIARPQGQDYGDNEGDDEAGPAMPNSPCRVRLELPSAPDLVNLVYDGITELALLEQDLLSLAPCFAVLHQVLHLTPAMAALFTTPWPYHLQVHDYGWICPRITLTVENGRYCGEPAVEECERCVARLGHRLQPGLTVAELRRWSAALAHGAANVHCPSADAAQRLQRHWPGVEITATPHSPPSQPTEPMRHNRLVDREHPLRVAVIGAISEIKGYAVLRACAEDARQRDLPLAFVLVGYSLDDFPLLATGRISITGEYPPEEGVALAAAADCDLALLPSTWPETWCYALDVAWKAGLHCLAFDIGAPAERIRAHQGRGTLLPLDSPPAAINAALLNLIAAPPAAQRIGLA